MDRPGTTRAPARHAAFAAALALTCAAGAAATQPPRELLGPGDTVRVTVFQNPDLGGELRLSENGTVVMPLAGEIAIGGQTPAAAGATIATRLARGRYLVDPQVTVALVELRSRQVSVLGHVARPGQYPLERPGMRLTELLAQAGGITDSGDQRVTAIVTRDDGTRRIEIDVAAMYANGDLTPDLELRGGDSIFVPPAPMFYLYGEVQRAGAYRLERDATVMRALALGGGLTPRGTLRGLAIHRRMPDGTIQRIKAGLTDPIAEGDVIRVQEGLF